MQVLFGAGLFLAPMIAGSAREATEDAGRDSPLPLEVKVEGAVLAYVPREIPRAKRTPRGEIELIEEATAVLRVNRALGFRRMSIDAGEYILRVESDEKRGHMLVLESRDGAEEKKEKGAGAERERSPKKGVERTAFAEGGIDPEPPGEKMPGEAGAAGAEAEPKPAKGRARERKSAEAAKEAEVPKPAPLLRVPLTLSPREKSDDTLNFDLKVSGRGTKLRIVIRAGATEARASLRLAEPAAER